jgi:predicted dehydrogenase
VISHFAYLADRLLGPGTVVESRVDRGADGLETGLDARVQHGHVAIEIRGSVGAASKDTYRFALECRDGTITIEDWDRLDGLPLTASDESPIAAFAAVLDGEPRDLADFPAGARVVQVIEALLA